jgi:hypothetical protein
MSAFLVDYLQRESYTSLVVDCKQNLTCGLYTPKNKIQGAATYLKQFRMKPLIEDLTNL